MMITTNITVSFKLPEERNLIDRFLNSRPLNEDWIVDLALPWVHFEREDSTVHIKVKENTNDSLQM